MRRRRRVSRMQAVRTLMEVYLVAAVAFALGAVLARRRGSRTCPVCGSSR